MVLNFSINYPIHSINLVENHSFVNIISSRSEISNLYQQGNIYLDDFEINFDPNLIKLLNDLGHKVHFNEEPLGGAQLIAIDWEKGVISAASDPRKDGFALGN